MMAAYPSSPPLHNLPLYPTVPLPMVDDGKPSSKKQSTKTPQTFPPWLALPTPPPSPPLSGVQPQSFGHPAHIMPAKTTFNDSNAVYLHPILESALQLSPHMMHEPKRPLPADVNNRLREPATNLGLGFLTIILLPDGRHVQVQPSAGGRSIVTLGDVLHVLRDLSERAMAYGAHIVDHEMRKSASKGPSRKGLWTWMVDGKPVAGYLTI